MSSQPEKKKIVCLTNAANLGGANIALLEYIDVLTDDYNFHVILPHSGNMEAALRKRNIPCSVIHQYGWEQNVALLDWMKWGRIAIRSWMAIRETKQLLIKEKADLVFTNTIIPFTAALAAYRLHIPNIWWVHEFGEEDFGFKIGWGKPARAYKKMQKWSRLVVYNSNAIANKFQQLMPLVRNCTIYQPVSWKGNNKSGEKLAKYLIFGQITPSKGHKEVLQVLALNKQKNLSCGGLHIKGPCENKTYLKELHEIISENNLEGDVKIQTGFFNKEEIMPLYDVLLVASRSEAFGRVIVEAQKAGLKVVVKNSGGAPELLNETNGLLYNTQEELGLILSGSEKIPEGPSIINYNEENEIEKLKQFLIESV